MRLDTLAAERRAGDPSVLARVPALAGSGVEATDAEPALITL